VTVGIGTPGLADLLEAFDPWPGSVGRPERDLALLGPRMADRAAVMVQPLEPGLLQLLQVARVDAAACEEHAGRDGVHGVLGRESVPDLAGQVGSEHELEAAGPVRWGGQHPLRLSPPCHMACRLEHTLTMLLGWR